MKLSCGNPFDRLVAYSSAPDVYDPPTPEECKAAAMLLAQAYDTLRRVVRNDVDAYNWAVWTLGSDNFDCKASLEQFNKQRRK